MRGTDSGGANYPVWAMGNIIEVEPNVLLCTYMNSDRSLPLLGQLVRITEKGIENIR